MPTVVYTTTPDQWTTAARVTASAGLDVFATNRGQVPVLYAVTENDTPPPFNAYFGHDIEPGADLSMTLATGERLWFTSRQAATQVTVTSGGTIS